MIYQVGIESHERPFSYHFILCVRQLNFDRKALKHTVAEFITSSDSLDDNSLIAEWIAGLISGLIAGLIATGTSCVDSSDSKRNFLIENQIEI